MVETVNNTWANIYFDNDCVFYYLSFEFAKKVELLIQSGAATFCVVPVRRHVEVLTLLEVEIFWEGKHFYVEYVKRVFLQIYETVMLELMVCMFFLHFQCWLYWRWKHLTSFRFNWRRQHSKRAPNRFYRRGKYSKRPRRSGEKWVQVNVLSVSLKTMTFKLLEPGLITTL